MTYTHMGVYVAHMSDQSSTVRATRRAIGWTQTELATAMNTTRDTVASWETGRRAIGGPAVRLLAVLEMLAAGASGLDVLRSIGGRMRVDVPQEQRTASQSRCQKEK